MKVRWQDVPGVFVTLGHSGDAGGFPDLWLIGWLTPGRDAPLQVWGSRGTKRMMSHLEQAYEYDIRIRLYDDRAVIQSQPGGRSAQETVHLPLVEVATTVGEPPSAP